MLLLSGTSNGRLSKELANGLGIDLVDVDIHRFPDGELYARLISDVRGQKVILVQSTFPDKNALEFFILSGLLKDQGAKRVVGVIPYYGYARQDRVFKPGESLTARTMARLISTSCDEVYCVNLHKESITDHFGTEIAKNVSVMRDAGEFLREKGMEHILAPDIGAVDYAREAALSAGCGHDHLEKTRVDGSTVRIAPKDLPVEGKKVCIVDDIIATGGTIERAARALREQGASEVHAFCVHGLFTGGGEKRLLPLLDGLYSTDTIENDTTALSAACALRRSMEVEPE